MDSPIKLAVVGVGWAGSRHADAITELRASDDRIEIACFVDNDPEHLEETASKYGVLQTYPSLGDALVGPLIDAVDIATPHVLHESMAVTALDAGKHVIVEKPMAMNVDEATRMIEAADANGVRLFVAENHTYEPYIKFLQKVVESGEPLGQVTAASVAS